MVREAIIIGTFADCPVKRVEWDNSQYRNAVASGWGPQSCYAAASLNALFDATAAST
jgi:hypothetical protein